MKSLLMLIVLVSSTAFSKELTWASLESELEGSNPEIQRGTLLYEASQDLTKAGSSVFLPEFGLVGGLGNKDTVELPEKGTQIYLRGKWNLFRGFRDFSTQKRLQSEEAVSQLDVEISKKQKSAEAKEIFLSLLTLKAQAEILEKETEVNRRQMAMAGKKVSAGLTSSVDNIEFELRRNTMLARLRKNKSEMGKKESALRALLDLPESESVVVSGNLPVPSKDFKLTTLRGSLKTHRSQLALEIARAEAKAIKSEFLPEVNLEAQFGRLTLQEGSAARTNESNYLLSVSIPLFSGLDTYQKSKAQNKLISASEKEIHIQELENAKVAAAFGLDWAEAWDLYELNTQTLKRMSAYYELTLSEYKRGIKNSPDLVSATERFFETQIENLELLKQLDVLQVRIQSLY